MTYVRINVFTALVQKLKSCLINTIDDYHNGCHKYCYVMHALTSVLVSSSVSILPQYDIYTSSVYFTSDFILRAFYCIVGISFEYIWHCVRFNLYCGSFILFCNMCVCVL
jgi:hypothetical protein